MTPTPKQIALADALAAAVAWMRARLAMVGEAA